MPKITQERLKEVLDYNPETGEFFWKIYIPGTTQPGQKAGCTFNTGTKTSYISICVDQQKKAAHQLAFLYMVGYIPDLIDHIDRNGLNNSWGNLRKVSKSENAFNSTKRIDNASGFKGVSCKKDCLRAKPWRAVFFHNGKQQSLGVFKTKEEAARAYDKRAFEVLGKFAILNFPEDYNINDKIIENIEGCRGNRKV